MSLVEVVVAVVVLGILASAVLAVVLQSQAVSAGNRSRVAAANLAAREIDLVREEFFRSDTSPVALEAAGLVTNPHPLPGGTAGQPLVVDGTAYTVKRDSQWNLTGNGQSACEGGSLVVYPTLQVTVVVTWPGMGSIKPVVSSAAMAPEKGNGIPGTDSFVAVKVTDSLGAPNPGRSVTVSGGGTSYSGMTDATGCAVVQVSPAVGAGTPYTVKATDVGYVDISGTTGPSKSTGDVARGQLNNSVTFSLDRAGTVRLRLYDPSGGSIDAAAVTGSQITMVASESAGAGATTPRTVTGVTTVVTGLWPTQYGAYYGVTAPAAGYLTTPLPPGGDITIDVPLELASSSIDWVPSGTTTVKALPNGVTDCASPSARTVDPAGFTLLPGTWSFFASGPTFTCAPGPAAVGLSQGANDGIEWLPSYLSVTNAPGGRLWAVHRSLAGTQTTCPTSATALDAVRDIDAARGGSVELPAGDWYVYRTTGSTKNSTCGGVPAGQYPKAVAYGTTTTLGWSYPNAVVTVSGAPSSSSTSDRVVYSTDSNLSCTQSSSSGAMTMTRSSTTPVTFSATLSPGTWHIYAWDTRSSGATNRCTRGGSVVVGGQTAYTLPFSTATKPTVGP